MDYSTNASQRNGPPGFRAAPAARADRASSRKRLRLASTGYCCLLAASLLFSPGLVTAQAPDLPEEAFVSGVPSHAQSLTLSCESRSAADWAAYFGVEVSESAFLENLPRSDNPEKGFTGDPNGAWGNIPPNSYGVHAGPVAAGLRGAGLEAEARSGLAWDDLRAEIHAGQPVIVWIIGQMWAGTPVSYQAEDGEVVTVAYFEHTMILMGYSPGLVHMIDSYSGLYQTYSLDTFLTSWSVLGNQAVIFSGETSPDSVPDEVDGETYTVQPGDYLNGLALQIGLPWADLATWNELDPPYTIYAGQALRITPPPETALPEPAGETLVEPPVSLPRVHTVAAGDTLLQIAGRYSTSWEELAALNGLLYPYFIYPHQQLQLPAGASEAARPVDEHPREGAAPAAPENPATYTVQAGEGLIQIAGQLGVDWLTLAGLNGIEYPYILYPGRILLLR